MKMMWNEMGDWSGWSWLWPLHLVIPIVIIACAVSGRLDGQCGLARTPADCSSPKVSSTDAAAPNWPDWTMVVPAPNLAKVIDFLLLQLAKLATTNM
jgi:hypothetical protein